MKEGINMKKNQKIIALLIVACMLFSVIPMFSLSAESDDNSVTYTNDFNLNGDLNALKDDFNFYHDTIESKANTLADITNDSSLSSYVTVKNDTLERVFNSATEKNADSDGNRPYWCMMYYTYKKQIFKDFTLEVDAYYPISGNSFNAITIGTLGGGFKSNGGFTFGFRNEGKNLATVFLGTASEVQTYFDDWYIHDSVNGHRVQITAPENFKYTIKIVVKDGLANVYINDEHVFKNRNVGQVAGYISLCNGIAATSYYDNLKISGTAVGDEKNVRIEENGKYQNNFNATDLSSLANDFNFYHDTTEQNYNTLYNITDEPTLPDYMTVANNALERIYNQNADYDPWEDGNRPYWSMMYYTYKNQQFEDFTLTVDAHLTGWGSSYHAISIGTIGNGFKSNSGYTLGFQIMGNSLCTFLGTASQVAVDFDDWYIHEGNSKNSIAVTSDNMYKITLTVKDGLATVMINGAEVYKDFFVGEVCGYISLANGISTGSYFDNLKIEGDGSVGNVRVEETGVYQNNFNQTDINTLLNDFNFYYDTTDHNYNSLSDITKSTDLMSYITVANGTLERVYNSTADKYPWEDGSRPYWCMTYATYKNQQFNNFTLSVDLYFPVWGTNYSAITVGSMGDGFKSNGGFTLGFQNRPDTGKVDMFLGNAADVAVSFDASVIKDGNNKASLPMESDSKYTLMLTVNEGFATVTVNGIEAYKNFPVGDITGYVSLCSGIFDPSKAASNYDNLKIAAVKDEEENDPSKYINKFSASTIEESLKDFIAYYSDNISKTEGVLTAEDYSNHWKLSGGKIIRKDQVGENFDETNYLAMVTYTQEKFNSFSYECDFVYGTTPGRILFGIGKENLDAHSTIKGGGLSLIFDSSGNASLSGYVDGVKYGAGASATINRGNLSNHIKITYYENYLSIELNDAEIIGLEVKGLNGYVSFGATKVANASFDNFTIIDYNKVVTDPELQSSVVSIDSVDDICWDRTEDNDNILNLPAALNITTDDGKVVKCRVTWNSTDYKPNLPGTYHYEGTPIMPPDKTLVNPNGIKATTTVYVTVDYNPATTVKYYIDSLDDFSKDWINMYSPDGRSEDMVQTSVSSTYFMDNGCIRRLDSAGTVGDHNEINSLVYTGRTFRNFRLDVDFRQGGNTWGQAMVAFGIEDTELYVTYPGGGAAAYITMEGNSRFRGSMVQETNSYGEVRSADNFTQYANTWKDTMHHLTLTVTKRKAILEIDGVEVLECKLKESYGGGYISLMSNKNMAIFDNLSVTALDYDGNVITLEEHDALPDTFDENDPLIGEEIDDGSGIEIIGLPYSKNINNKYLPSQGILDEENASHPSTGDQFPIHIFVTVTVLSGIYITSFIFRKHKR